jgi:hypothetical protein
MKKKILVIFICMLMTASTTILITPEKLQVKAAGGGSASGDENNVGINTTYIYDIADYLSWIGKTNERGRSFGTPGELDAKNRIIYWMNQIGLDNVHNESITGTTQHPDLDKTLEILSMGIKINGTQTITDFFISPRWNGSIISDIYNFTDYAKLSYNCSENNPLPIYRKPWDGWFDIMFSLSGVNGSLLENITLGNIYNLKTFIEYCARLSEIVYDFTFEEYNESNSSTYPSFYNGTLPWPNSSKCGSFLFIDEDLSFNPNATSPPLTIKYYENLSIPQIFYGAAKSAVQMMFWACPFYPGRCKGLILYDFNDDTYDMTNGFLMALPMLYVNKSVGKPIYDSATIATPANRTISFWINQSYNSMESYNIIGQINGTNPNKTVLIDCLYDCWWNQGTSDAAIGMGTVLALAKYFKDHHITPKYTLKFVAFGGEEYAYLGAQHYNDTHTNENITLVIDLNQIGFSQTGPLPQTLYIHLNNASLIPLLGCITNETHYQERTGVPYLHTGYTYYGAPSDDSPFAIACWNGNRSLHTICFLKDMNWTLHHRDGQNHNKGDTMDYYNETDVDVTAEMIWNVTKYFTVNPDCQFHTITYEAINTTNGTAPDTLHTTFTVQSILPSDLVTINASFYSTASEQPLNTTELNIIATETGVEQNITFTIPTNTQEGDYYITLKVYNSTARINRTLGYTNASNDTRTSPTFHLNKYHTLGDIRIGTETADAHDIIRGSKFTPLENAVVYNITAYVYGTSSPSAPTYQCMIYNASDDHLLGYTDQVVVDETGWMTFTFATKPVLYKNTEYLLTIWGDTTTANMYATPLTDGENAYHANYTFGTPPTSIIWNDTLDAQQFSLFCSYIPVNIINVQASPHTVGYGFNVTISADVSALKGVSQVKVHIDPSEGGFGVGNYTMTYTSGDTYQYVFPLTWTLWRYNFTIWIVDNVGYVNSSSGHHFHVSINASISIATLQDTYTGDEYINITDPPNPPENLTVVGRGITWDEYYNDVTGQNILKVSTMPINYQDDNDTWTPINTTLNQLPSNHPKYVLGYRKGNDQGLYGLYFKTNAQQEWPVAFTYNRSDDPTTYAVRSKLMGVGYVDPTNNWSYEYLQSMQSSQGQTTGNSITYEEVFTGTDVTWSYSNTGLKEEIILSNTTKTLLQNHPPSQYGLDNVSSYLVFITKLDHQNLNIYNTSGLLDDNVTISDDRVDFKDTLGRFTCSLPLGEVYELNNESVRQKLTYRIIHLNGNTYLFSGLRVSDLSAMTFPVVIDPTIKVYPTTSDGHISNSSTSYTTAWTATTGAISSTSTTFSIGQQPPGIFPTYYVYRGYLFFDTTTLPSNAYIDNATLGLYKSTDYSTTDFLITVQNGQPTYPHDPLQTGDYNKNQYSGSGGVINTSGLFNGYNNITLTNDGKSWLNQAGITKLCLRSNRDINGNTPTNNEYVKIYASEQGTGYEPLLTIIYRNQSKIKNTGSTTFKGYLLIQVQYNDSGTWVVDNDLVNETSPRTITILDQLALDKSFNGMLKASELHNGNGTYRVYTAFRDPNGAILKTERVNGGRIGSAELKAWWEFTKI